MYPYVDNYALICYTWTQELSHFSRLRINPTKDAGKPN